MSLKIRELSHKSLNTVKELGDVASDLRELSGISLKTVKMLGDLSSRVVKENKKRIKNQLFQAIGMTLYEEVKGEIIAGDYSRYAGLEVYLQKLLELDKEIGSNNNKVPDAIEAPDQSDDLVCECGNRVPRGTSFCSNCGVKIIVDTEITCACGNKI